MVIVSGFLHVRPDLRAAYLDGCRAVVLVDAEVSQFEVSAEQRLTASEEVA